MALSVTATERPSWKEEDTLEMSLRALDSLARSLCLWCPAAPALQRCC